MAGNTAWQPTGAPKLKSGPSGAVIRQGKYRLEAELLNERRQPLQAPVEGRMERTIHESLCAEVRYRFWRRDNLLLQHTDPNASFEYSSAD